MCSCMKKCRDPFPVPSINRARDHIAPFLVRMFLPVADSPEDPTELLSEFPTRRVLDWLARLYGFEANMVRDLLHEDGGQRALWNLLKSLSDYGVRTPQTLKAPVSVVWSLSRRCNLRCLHCYQNASLPSSDELTLEQQLNTVNQLAEVGVSMIVLSGGEPLTNPNLCRLIERIRDHRIAISIDSNGVLIDRNVAESLKRLGVTSVELSLDSVNAGSHDRFRGADGAFKKTLDAIEACSDAGIFTTVATTATTLNYADSGELISLAREHGAHRVVFFDLIPAGRGRDVENLRLSRRQLLDLMALVGQKSFTKGGEVFTELPQFVVYSSFRNGFPAPNHAKKALSIEKFTVSSFFDCAGRGNIYRSFAPYLGGCPAGRLYCNIQPNGDVTPCMFMPDYPIAGNLRKQSFKEIWDSPTFQALRNRSNLKGKCHECKFAIVCGGCRAKAAAYQGDYLASDPTCPYQSENA